MTEFKSTSQFIWASQFSNNFITPRFEIILYSKYNPFNHNENLQCLLTENNLVCFITSRVSLYALLSLHCFFLHVLEVLFSVNMMQDVLQALRTYRWRRVLLLADLRLFLRWQVPLQTYTRPTRPRQETMTTLIVSPYAPNYSDEAH